MPFSQDSFHQKPKQAASLIISGLAVFLSTAQATLTSFETGETVTRVRSAQHGKSSRIIASSYHGSVIALSQTGSILWKNELSGFMNRDLWCVDLTGDQKDEILAANADGHLYCLNSDGSFRWKFHSSEAPLNAVTAIKNGDEILICCGGYEKNIHWLDSAGQQLKTIPSSSYSREKPWGKPLLKRLPKKHEHIANFLRPMRWKDKEILCLHAAINSNAANGKIYLFEPLHDQPFQVIAKPGITRPTGDLTVCDLIGDGNDELIFGSSSMTNDGAVSLVSLDQPKTPKSWTIRDLKKRKELRKNLDGLGYRVAQTVPVGPSPHASFLTAFGSRFIHFKPDFTLDGAEVIPCSYSFNDIWKDPRSQKIILASVQSGGSCVHLLDPSQPGWKKALNDIKPRGTIQSILEETAKVATQLKTFSPPSHERKPQPVFFLTESLHGELEKHALSLEKSCGTPRFLKGQFFPRVEKWDRKSVTSDIYRKRRDSRRKYEWPQSKVLDYVSKIYADPRDGVAFWGGHGNDPYLLSTDTMKKIITMNQGEKSVFIYPELEKWDSEFATVLEDHIYPIAEASRGQNAQLYIRTKHTFWQSIIHLPLWSRLLSGEFADVFIPSMEETTDKTPELSIAGRLGIWASGAVNQWGSRVARDNPSFDRLRQHSHQMLPNHFLRNQIYHLSLGATYQNNFPVDQDYFRILYDLIAKGALYVPKREEIVSFNPVHLSIVDPDPRYLDEGNNLKWITFFNPEEEKANPMVFNRLNGSWPGAPNLPWDFSTFAAGVKDRHLNFLPTFPHGLVLITPPNAPEKNLPRGQLTDHLHPMYRDIMQEFRTDGRDYLSANRRKKFPADDYYKVVSKAIYQGSSHLPLTVSGKVAWSAAQTSPNNLRLTLIDGGYLDPKTQKATINFHAVKPTNITDVLSGETISLKGQKSLNLEVPAGLFRFFDISLENPFPAKK